MELVPTDEEDRPLTEIKILSTQVFVNPLSEESLEAEKRAAEAKQKKDSAKDEGEMGQWYSHPQAAAPSTSKTGVGKYLPESSSSGSSSSSGLLGKKRPLDLGAVREESVSKKPKTDPFSRW
jgi:peptidyl-prolyl cis-trans isomerase-like protein 2